MQNNFIFLQPVYYLMPVFAPSFTYGQPLAQAVPTLDQIAYQEAWQEFVEKIMDKPRRGYKQYVYRYMVGKLTAQEWLQFQVDNRRFAVEAERKEVVNSPVNRIAGMWERVRFQLSKGDEVKIGSNILTFSRQYSIRERVTGQGLIETYRCDIKTITFYYIPNGGLLEACFSYQFFKLQNDGQWNAVL